MTDFEINFNDKESGSTIDGFLSWTARGTQDGAVPPASFYVNDNGEKQPLAAMKKEGVVIDIYNMKTGWSFFDGSATQWQWNDTLTNWQAQPGEDWKKGLQIDVLAGESVYLWRQAGVAVTEGFKRLAEQFAGKATGKLPKIKLKGTDIMKFKVGQTSVPLFEIVDWVERPLPLDSKGETTTDEKEEF